MTIRKAQALSEYMLLLSVIAVALIAVIVVFARRQTELGRQVEIAVAEAAADSNRESSVPSSARQGETAATGNESSRAHPAASGTTSKSPSGASAPPPSTQPQTRLASGKSEDASSAPPPSFSKRLALWFFIIGGAGLLLYIWIEVRRSRSDLARGGFQRGGKGGSFLGSDGQAMVEFALIAPILITMIFLLLQYGLFLCAVPVADWAAWNAARAASVYVPLGPGDAMIVPPEEIGRPQALAEVEPAGALSLTRYNTLKWKRIKWAADYACAALVTPGTIRTFQEAAGSGGLGEMITQEMAGKSRVIVLLDQVWGGQTVGALLPEQELIATRDRLAVASLLTRVRLDETSADPDSLYREFGETELISIRVDYHFPMIIPLARTILGRQYSLNPQALSSPEAWMAGALSPTQKGETGIPNMLFRLISVTCAFPREAVR